MGVDVLPRNGCSRGAEELVWRCRLLIANLEIVIDEVI